MKRKGLLVILCAALVLSLQGCASTADPLPSASPSPSASVAPTVSEAPAATQTAGPSASPVMGVGTLERVQTVSDEMTDEVKKLSEVSEAVALVVGDTALIGVAYDNQYQEGTTERIRTMLQERMDGIVSGITEIVITDDPDMISAIQELKDSLTETTGDYAALRDQFQSLVKRVNGGSGMTNTTAPTNTAGPTDGGAAGRS